ncbi:MAG: hypothetical protein ACRDK1_02030 [Solirubrobacterales bacterium]
MNAIYEMEWGGRGPDPDEDPEFDLLPETPYPSEQPVGGLVYFEDDPAIDTNRRWHRVRDRRPVTADDFAQLAEHGETFDECLERLEREEGPGF